MSAHTSNMPPHPLSMATPSAGPSSFVLKINNDVTSEATTCLGSLDTLIEDKGYAWLAEYMDGVQGMLRDTAEGRKKNKTKQQALKEGDESSNFVQLLKTPSRQAAAAARKRPIANAAANIRNPNNLGPKPITSTSYDKENHNNMPARAGALPSPAQQHAKESVRQIASPAPIRGEPHPKTKKANTSTNPFLAHSAKALSAPEIENVRPASPELEIGESESESVAEDGPEEPRQNDASAAVKAALDQLSLVDDSKQSQTADQPMETPEATTPAPPASLETPPVEFDIPLRDDSDTPAKTPAAATAADPKTVFSPSSLTFAALPARDPIRGRSIGASKHHRLTIAANATAAQEKDATAAAASAADTPPLAAVTGEPTPAAAPAAAGPSTQARSAKVRSSWLRHAIAAAGGEEGLRKSVAASVVMQTNKAADVAKEEAARGAAVEQPKAAPLPAIAVPKPPTQRFTLLPGSKPAAAAAQPPPAPVEQPAAAALPQSNLSRMIASLQEKKAAAAASQPARALNTTVTITAPGSMLEVGLGPSSSKLNAGSWNALRGTTSGGGTTIKNGAQPDVVERRDPPVAASRCSSSRRSDSSTEEADEQRDNDSSHRDFVTAQQTVVPDVRDSPLANVPSPAPAEGPHGKSSKQTSQTKAAANAPVRPSIEKRTTSSSSAGKQQKPQSSSTPPNTPPRNRFAAFITKTAPIRSRPSVQVAAAPANVARTTTATELRQAPARQAAGDRGMTMSQALSVVGDSDDDQESSSEDELAIKPEVSMHEDLEEAVALLAKGMKLSNGASEPVEESVPSSLASSTSQMTSSVAGKTGTRSHLLSASEIARKIDGQKPSVGPIDSIMRAQQAKQRDAEIARKRAAEREARDRRKREEQAAKEEEEKRKADLAKKERLAQLEKNRLAKLEIDRKRKEAADRQRAVKEEQLRKEKAAAAALAAAMPKVNKAEAPKPKAPLPHAARASHAKSQQQQASMDLLSSTTAESRAGPQRPAHPLKSVASSSAVGKTTSSANAPAVRLPQAKLSTQAGNGGGFRPQGQAAAGQHRSSTITPMRTTITPGIALTDFQRLIAAGGSASPGGRPEDIELPDIDSNYGYSDSEDEEDKKAAAAAVPSWAESPMLRKAAAEQQRTNPSFLFGPMPEFKMEAVFDNAKMAKRPRSSSANWSGQDRLTEQEKLEYAKRMNYRALDDLELAVKL